MRAMKFIFFIAFFSCSTKAQQLIYDLPASVTKKIDQHISQYSDTTKFVILFSSMDSAKYRVTIMEDFSKNPSFKDVNETLVQKTNRFIRVNETLIPFITWEDINFADFGTVYTPESKSEKRKVGKKKIIFTTDAYGVTFDSSGKIY